MNIKASTDFQKRVFFLFSLLTVMTLVAGIVFYLFQTSGVEDEIKEKLQKVAYAKSAEIDRWYTTTINEGVALFEIGVRQEKLLGMLDPAEKDLMQFILSNWRPSLRVDKGFVTFFLVDDDINVLQVVHNSSTSNPDLSPAKALRGAKKPTFSKFFIERTDSGDAAFVYLFVPGETIAGKDNVNLLAKIDPRRDLLPRLWSATRFLGSQENRMHVPIISDTNYLFVFDNHGIQRIPKRPDFDKFLAYKTQKGDSGFVQGLDYRSVMSFAYIVRLGEHNCQLISKIDKEEIYAPARTILFQSMSGVALVLFVLFISAKLLLKKQENEILKRVVEAELEKEKNEKLLSAIIESSPDAIMLVDPVKEILTRFNNKAEQMFALHLAGPTVRLDPLRFHKRVMTEEEKAVQRRILMEEKVWRGDVEYVSLDGREFWGNVVVSLLEVSSERFFMVRVSDITREKKILTELQELTTELQKADEEKVKFMSVLAHDLRSPFHPLLNILDMLSSDYDTMSEDERKHFLESAGEIAVRHFEFLESLLNWSRASLGKISFNPRPVSPVTIINETILLQEHLATEKGIKLTTRINTSDDVNADPEMLRTILRNLLVNAIKFTHSSGAVTVSAETEGENVVFSISDTGVGIPHDQISRLFTLDGSRSTPGTGNEQGTGLGLLLCKEFVNLHGGKIWVQSSPETGSVFSFTMQVFKQ